VPRSPFLARLRRPAPDGGPPAGPFPPPRRALPPPGQLRRERRALLRAREERLRDLGGLMLEMYRRDQFRQDLLVGRCNELIALEDRLHEVESLLSAAVSVRRAAPAARCTCGAPLHWGSHFCANCGRPTPQTPPVVACASCGSPLPADVRFCPSCGRGVDAARSGELVGALPPPSPGPPPARES
jgi:hypothetical protein